MTTYPKHVTDDPDDEQAIARIVADALARPLQVAAEVTGPPLPVPEEVRLYRIMVSREIVDRLVIDLRVAAADQPLWRAMTISWTAHLMRWGVRPEDLRELEEAFVDTFDGFGSPGIVDLRVARDEMRRRRVEAGRRREQELRERGRTLTGSAQTSCLRCLSTGYERMFDREGRDAGVRPGCRHDRVPPGRLQVYLRDPVAAAFWQRVQSTTGGDYDADADDHGGGDRA